MFQNCSLFNQPLSFDTSAVINMNSMFFGCSVFNNALTFNTSAVIDMQYMFYGCTNFNQPLNFNTSGVTNMQYMFNSATAFDQNIGAWNITSVTNFSGFMLGKTPATWSQLNFDNLLCGWSLLPSVQPSLTIDFGTAVYTTAIAQPCYDILDLAPNNWTINSNGGV